MYWLLSGSFTQKDKYKDYGVGWHSLFVLDTLKKENHGWSINLGHAVDSRKYMAAIKRVSSPTDEGQMCCIVGRLIAHPWQVPFGEFGGLAPKQKDAEKWGPLFWGYDWEFWSHVSIWIGRSVPPPSYLKTMVPLANWPHKTFRYKMLLVIFQDLPTSPIIVTRLIIRISSEQSPSGACCRRRQLLLEEL